jgi:guanosine-3',5'-bis(diphosphate) 3'-pyrophosphohydrolase
MRHVPTIEQTIAFINTIHHGQERRDGKPYVSHPIAVMELLPKAASMDAKLAALLHDTLEKSHKFPRQGETEIRPVTREELGRMGYSDRTIRAVELTSKIEGIGVYREGMSYLEWINAIIKTDDLDTMQVKYADMLHNTDPQSLEALSTITRDDGQNEADYRRDKYKMPMILLRRELERADLLEMTKGRSAA